MYACSRPGGKFWRSAPMLFGCKPSYRGFAPLPPSTTIDEACRHFNVPATKPRKTRKRKRDYTLTSAPLTTTSTPAVVETESEGETKEDVDGDFQDTSSEQSVREVFPMVKPPVSVGNLSIPDLPKARFDFRSAFGAFGSSRTFGGSSASLVHPPSTEEVLSCLLPRTQSDPAVSDNVGIVSIPSTSGDGNTLPPSSNVIEEHELIPSGCGSNSMFKGYFNDPSLGLYIEHVPSSIEELGSSILEEDKVFFNQLPEGHSFGLQMLLEGSQMLSHHMGKLKHQLSEAKQTLPESKDELNRTKKELAESKNNYGKLLEEKSITDQKLAEEIKSVQDHMLRAEAEKKKAVEAGIAQCCKKYTETLTIESNQNFGLGRAFTLMALDIPVDHDAWRDDFFQWPAPNHPHPKLSDIHKECAGSNSKTPGDTSTIDPRG